MTIKERAWELMSRWRPYLKVVAPSEGFPKNQISMIEDIEREMQAAIDEDRNVRTADDLYKWSREGGFKEGFSAARGYW